MGAEVCVQRQADDGEAAGGEVAGQRVEGQRRGRVGLVAVDDVHVRRHEDADDAEADQDRGDDRRPD